MIIDPVAKKVKEWDLSYNYYQFGKLDWLISHQVASFKDVVFPILENDIAQQLVSEVFSQEKLKRLERCKVLIEHWAHELIERSVTFPVDAKDLVYKVCHEDIESACKYLNHGPLFLFSFLPCLVGQHLIRHRLNSPL